jgi:outer membrane biosynthesis protein TonB
MSLHPYPLEALSMCRSCDIGSQQTTSPVQQEASNTTQSHGSPQHIYNVGGDVSSPHLLKQVDFVPPTVELAQLSGIYQIQMVVDASGTPTHVKLLNSLSPRLDKAFLDSVSQYEFSPALLHGEPVAVVITMEMRVNMPYKHQGGLLRR